MPALPSPADATNNRDIERRRSNADACNSEKFEVQLLLPNVVLVVQVILYRSFSTKNWHVKELVRNIARAVKCDMTIDTRRNVDPWPSVICCFLRLISVTSIQSCEYAIMVLDQRW
jgi:hypothetical protein